MNGMYGYFDPFAYEPFAEVPTIGAETFGVAGIMLGFLAVFYIALLAFGIVTYIFQSLGIYTIAKRRQINHPWLAWIPVGVLWIIGSISDQYQYVGKGRVRNRRKILLGVVIATYLLLIPMIVSLVAFLIGIAGESVAGAGISAIVLLLSYLAMLVLEIILLVYYYICLYDLYVSCEPGNATAYLVLSILFSVAQPFFMFFSRKKDLGMPPRKETAQPVVKPELPVAEEVPAEPVCEETPTEETPVEEATEEAPEVTE